MKKVLIWLLILIIGSATFYLSINYNKNIMPNLKYAVYLDGKIIGTINSKKELEDYIDASNEELKKTYNVDKIYAPTGLVIKRVKTYGDKISSVEDVYSQIASSKAFTVNGYEMTIKTDDKYQKILVIDENVFRQAVEKVIEVFVGKENYELYLEKKQPDIETTGSKIQNIYIDNNINVKEIKIATDQKIYTNVEELSEYFIYGNSVKQKKYTVKAGDTISSVALDNEISTDELLMSNTALNNDNTLLAIGQELLIKESNPQLDVITEVYSIQDIESKYRTNEFYNAERVQGDDSVIQQGENGLERVTQTTKSVNGTILYVQPHGKEELKPSIDKIIEKGQKIVSNIGTLDNWFWPTISGYTISTPYGTRINPITRVRETHAAIDIAGLGSGSPIYAANYGTFSTVKYNSSYGNYIIINHNNGYYTLYAHLLKFSAATKEGVTVRKGQIIGYMGSTGMSTGAHLHFELWRGKPFGGGSRINPWTFY